jgi:hypothetical protein
MSTIVAKCPGVVKKDFKGYIEADPGRTPLERGFYARHERRNITHIFIFDRAAASALVPPMAPSSINFESWRLFEATYIEHYATNRLRFIMEMTRERTHQNRGQILAFALADTVFNASSTNTRFNQSEVVARIDFLLQLDVLPSLGGEAVGAGADATMAVDAPSRSTRSGGDAIPDEVPEVIMPHELTQVWMNAKETAIRAAEAGVAACSEQDCVFAMMVEEWVLGVALSEKPLQDKDKFHLHLIYMCARMPRAVAPAKDRRGILPLGQTYLRPAAARQRAPPRTRQLALPGSTSPPF